MHVDITADQTLLQDTSRRFLAEQCPITEVRRLGDTAAGFERRWWRQAAELGWTSMLVDERDGGGSVSGAGLIDLTLVANELGTAVAPGPLVPVNVVASALSAWGSEEQRGEHLPGLVSGETVAAWGLAETGTWDAAGVVTRAEPAEGGWRLTGIKTPVEAAAEADVLLVAARTPDGVAHFLVPAGAPGLTVTPLRSLDLVRRFAAVHLDGVAVPETALLGSTGAGGTQVDRMLQIAGVLQCAETVGAIERVFTFTVEYAFDRFSFGRPLASYQALKHRFADMKTWLEASHATADGAAAAVQEDAAAARELVSVAAAYIGDRSTAIIQDCVQMHGGIGVTWDHDIHLYLRRATANRALYGTPEQHRERLASLMADR